MRAESAFPSSIIINSESNVFTIQFLWILCQDGDANMTKNDYEIGSEYYMPQKASQTIYIYICITTGFDLVFR